MEALSKKLLDAAKSNMVGDFLQHGWTHQKKTAESWRVSGALSAYPHEPAQQETRRKPKTNLRKEMKGSYQMKKMKKACAVLLAVLSVSLLASAFAGEDNAVRFD